MFNYGFHGKVSALHCVNIQLRPAVRMFVRLPDLVTGMLVEVQKVNRASRGLQGFLVCQIQQD